MSQCATKACPFPAVEGQPLCRQCGRYKEHAEYFRVMGDKTRSGDPDHVVSLSNSGRAHSAKKRSGS